ncbi:Uncharacterised protein [Burkholderia pseudomallei]|nr:Uncharacterised protein [Burkholderia pseudomallei]
MRFGHAVEPLPRGLRQPRAAEEVQLHAREERRAQRAVALERGRQRFPALRHVEVGRRRDLAQVAHCLVEAIRRRPAVVDIQRAAVVKRDADVVAAAERVVPRQPVDEHGRRARELRHRLAQHLLIAAQHPVRRRHRFGLLRRARREQDLRQRVGAHARVRAVDRVRAHVEQPFERNRAKPRRRRAARDDHGRIGGRGRGERGGERVAVGGEQRARLQHAERVLELAEIGRHERIRGRDRRIGNAREHRREAELQMREIVARQDRERPLGGQPEREQPFAERAGALEHARIRDLDPAAVCAALRGEHARRMIARARDETIGQPLGVRAERLDGAHAPAVAVALDVRRAARDVHAPVARRR